MHGLADQNDEKENRPSSRLVLMQLALDSQLLGQLLQARHIRNLTTEEVARRMGVHQSVVIHFESGRSVPTLALLDRYAHAVGVLVLHDVQFLD